MVLIDDAMAENGEFLTEYVDQIHMATDSIFKEIKVKSVLKTTMMCDLIS